MDRRKAAASAPLEKVFFGILFGLVVSTNHPTSFALAAIGTRFDCEDQLGRNDLHSAAFLSSFLLNLLQFLSCDLFKASFSSKRLGTSASMASSQLFQLLATSLVEITFVWRILSSSLGSSIILFIFATHLSSSTAMSGVVFDHVLHLFFYHFSQPLLQLMRLLSFCFLLIL